MKRALFVLILMGCSDSTEPDPPPPPPESVASVAVTPSTATLVSLGETVQLAASAQEASGNTISGKTFTWSSSDVSIATVSSSGLATAIANGAATITATTEGVQGSASLTVSPPAAFQVAISAVVTSKGFNATTNREECRYTVTAVASGGSSAEYALWTTYDWEFRHPDGTVQTINATQSETVDFWGSDRLVTGTSRTANRIAWHPSKKFTLFYTFRYLLTTGEQRTGTVSVDCI